MYSISALDVTRWGEHESSRSLLPVLVRKLIHAAGGAIQSISFPAYESVSEPDWDGVVERSGGSAWAPEGQSFWEVSCEKTVSSKANREFKKRTETTPPVVRARSTFVFVTTRSWRGKRQWQAAALDTGWWADVRIYDAEALSHWVEQTPAVALWLNAKLGRSVEHLCSLEDHWTEWASVTRPALPFGIFAQALEENGRAIQDFFGRDPEGPLHVGADTRSEAGAFAAGMVLFSTVAANTSTGVVLKTPAGVQWAKAQSTLPVIVVADPELEPLLGDLPYRARVIVATDKASPGTAPAVLVEPLTWDAFHRAAGEMELTGEEADALSHESGKRITIIRRRLATVDSVRVPRWAETPEQTETLIGLALAGGWFWEREGDRRVLEALTGHWEDDLERQIHRLTALEDAPIFLAAGAGGLISRHDAFPALKHALTPGLIRRFFKVLEEILAAPDPTLDLPSERRWMANIYDKERPHSGRLRQQIVATLVFLTAAGSRLAGASNVAAMAHTLVEKLFADGDGAWMRLRDVLPGLAEAAPSAFLAACAESLPREQEDGGIWQLIKPTERDSFGETFRLNVIWALERLAWNPDHFTRTASVLAALAQRPLDDNLVTKPAASLLSIFHPSAPQTGAPEAQRTRTLAALATEHPAAIWQLCLQLMDQRLSYIRRTGRRGAPSESIEINPKPTRAEPDTRGAVIDILLGRNLSDAEALQLIEVSACFDGEALNRLWDRVEAWQSAATEQARSRARRSVLRTALWRTRVGRKSAVQADPRALKIFWSLGAKGPAGKCAWLFDAMHIDGAEAIWPEVSGWKAQEERVNAEREKAVDLLLESGRPDVLLAFAQAVGHPGSVAWSVGKSASQDFLVATLVELFSAEFADWGGRLDFVGHLLGPLESDARRRLLSALATEWAASPATLLELLLLCHSDEVTWWFVDELPSPLAAGYWARTTRRVHPSDPQAMIRASRELLKAGRPVAALHQGSTNPRLLDTDLLVELLDTVAKVEGPKDDGSVYPETVEDYFEALDERTDVEQTTALRLEFTYAKALEHTSRGASTIDRELSTNPAIFVEGAKYYLLRDDGADDPELADIEQHRLAFEHWESLLDNCRLPPGAAEGGNIDPGLLKAWLGELCPMLEGIGRLNTGLFQVGEWLGRTRREVEGNWPDIEVAQVLEPYAGPKFRRGLALGILNSRGVHSRPRMAGGAPERELAEKFRSWRRRFEIECPNLAEAFEDVAESYDRNAARHDDERQFERAAPG